ncbi:VOC family virulence protein [Veronia nyctiphanis]|uniref:VOC family virulence protein n=2 Tax=Veronia nyctiphanis TaxID=1278244 RepID=A0A4Q0YPC1_9GAMM|nr:VOC family protein [Veronia nyctiphanis]RXJ72776.1 VOC family virulence protein [Veronia nyctiphanis]
MLKIARLDHIVLRTNDVSNMVRFYCEVLNCHVERTTDPEIGLTQIRAGSALIDLVDVNSSLGKSGGGAPSRSGNSLDHFCLLLEKIDNNALLEHLSDHHVKHSGFANRYGSEGFGPSLYIEDPDGNTVELKSEHSSR